MSLDVLSALPLDTAKPPPATSASIFTPMVSEATTRARIDKTAKDYEASFLSVMFGQMFQGVSVSPPFGGGDSETAFRSFLTDSMSKSMAQHGGIGLAGAVRKEMLKLQGLT